MLEFEHEPIVFATAVAVTDRDRPVQYRRREINISDILVVQCKRHEKMIRSERSGLDHFSDRSCTRRRRHRLRFSTEG